MLKHPEKSADRIHPPAIKRSTELTEIIILRILGLLSVGLWLLLLILWHNNTTIFDGLNQLLGVNIIICVTSFSTSSSILIIQSPMREYAIRKNERKRRAAAQEESKLLADHYPTPNTSGIILPLKIHYRTKFSPSLSILIIILFAFIIFGILYVWTLTSLGLIITVILLCGGMCTHLIMVFINHFGRWLIADEDGLTIKRFQSSKGRYILWSQARLFSISGTKRATFFEGCQLELASKGAIISWPIATKSVKQEKQSLSTVNPTDHYIQNIQALHAIIAEKTGLSLYDLRKRL